MKYAYTIIYVKNVTETVTFYEKAFGFKKKFITPENDYAELISGETTLAFASITLGKSNLTKGFTPITLYKEMAKTTSNKPMGIELAFTTEHIEADVNKALQAGATSYEPIKSKPWGQKVAYVLDNNGLLIEICTPITNTP